MKQVPINLTSHNLTYKEWKVDYDPTSDECIARGRTHRLLLEVSGLVEHTRRNSDRHNAILSAIATGKDHPSNYMYGSIPIVMIEPYGAQVYEFPGLKLYKLPKILSPYGTCNGFETQSLLCVRQLNAGVLAEIEAKVSAALPNLPDRYHVTPEERKSAGL